MIKKKRADEEDAGQENHAEVHDNKDNNIMPEDISDTKSEEAALENRSAGEGVNEAAQETPSDKSFDQSKELLAKLAEMQDKYLRLSAEFDNYRKRTLREKIELSKYASEDVLVKLLPVMDDFERAVNHMEISTECTAMKSGIDLIYVKFADFFKQNGIKEIESLGCQFNVDIHDAAAKVAVEEEDKKGKIIDVILKGYYLQDKVIRHAKVVVGE
jgi:molecular chaperone GrpE